MLHLRAVVAGVEVHGRSVDGPGRLQPNHDSALLARFRVFATTLRNNLTLARPGATDDAVLEALDRAGLGRLASGLTDGLDTVLGAGGRGLSGGERARLAIARAHLSGRPVIALDEPVAHLDPPTARSVLTDLLAPSRGTDDRSPSVVLVTHRPDGLDLVDRVFTVTHPHR